MIPRVLLTVAEIDKVPEVSLPRLDHGALLAGYVLVFNAEALEECLGKRFGKLYVISGGSQADAVNQRMAMWLGREVYCGLIEAAATGNMLAQLAALDIPVDKNALSQAATNGKMRRFAP